MPEHTHAELNAAIARWMGWKHNENGYFSSYHCWLDPLGLSHVAPPAYASDLNVWDDVWPVIEGYGYEDHFGVELMKVQLNQPPCRTGYYECAKATARQRAEALVRVIGGGE